MGRLHDAKQQGYGTAEDPFANYRAAAKAASVPAWVYVTGRIAEKMLRLQAGGLGNTSVNVLEELRDIALMGAIARVLYQEASASADRGVGPFSAPTQVVIPPMGPLRLLEAEKGRKGTLDHPRVVHLSQIIQAGETVTLCEVCFKMSPRRGPEEGMIQRVGDDG